MNILIADDELRLRKVVALFLRKNGHDVTEAVSGEQAIELMHEFAKTGKLPDVIVLDVRMTGITGIETTQIIKSDGRFGAIPIVLLTANVSSDDREMGAKAGADAYITKPFSPKALLEKISEITGQ